MFRNRKIWIYLVKFIGVFCVLYFGTLAMIGLAAPANHYSPFVAKYMDYVSWIKISLIKATGILFSVFGVPTHPEPGFLIRVDGGRGVFIAMDCVGYGVYSFWTAFVIANDGNILKKISWIAGGLLALWFINVVRVSLFLVAINKGWPMPLGIDHHTWFTIAAYLLIFALIWRYDKARVRSLTTKENI